MGKLGTCIAIPQKNGIAARAFYCTGPFAFDAAFLCADRLP